MKNLIKNNAILVTSLILFTIALLFSWYMGLIAEDVSHFGAKTLQEAYDIALQSRNNTNTRLGELSMYFMGISTEGTGTIFALWLYRFINPIFIVACTFFIFRLGIGHWPTNSKPDVISFIFIALCMLENKTNHYWFCGNLSWFYPAVIAMLMFILIEPFFKGEKINITNFIIAILCTPIVGMSNESVAITSVSLYCLAGYLYLRKNKTWIPDRKYLIIGFLLIFFAVLFYTASGPYKRVAPEMGDLTKLEYTIRNIFSSNWLHVLFWCWRIIIIAITILILCPLKNWNTSRSKILLLTITMLGGILMIAPNFGAPRSLIPVELILMTLLSGVIYRTTKIMQLQANKIKALFILLIALSLTILIPNTIRSIDNARFFALIQYKANEIIYKGETHLIIKDKEIQLESIWNFPYFKIPRTLLEIYPLYTESKPLLTTTQKHYENSDFKHKYALFPYKDTIYGSDLTLNKGLAKYFGLEAIIVIKSEEDTQSK